MRSQSKLTAAGIALALVLFAAQAGLAKPRQGITVAPTPATDPGWLGVSIQNLEGDLKAAMPRGVTEGAIVNSVVEGSPAEKAGLEEGDIVTRFNDKSIGGTDDLTAAVRDAGAGATVPIEYYRDGRLLRDRVTLSKISDSAEPRAPRAFRWMQKNERDDSDDSEADDSDEEAWVFHNDDGPMAFMFQGDRPARLGVRLFDLGDQLAAYFKVQEKGGALVTEVEEDSPAAKAGIQAGDVIVSIDERAVEDAGDVQQELRRHEEAGPVSVGVVRDGRTQTFTAELDKAERSFGMRAPRMERFRMMHPDIDVPAVPMSPEGIDRQGLRKEMRELRRQLDELKKELSELRQEKS